MSFVDLHAKASVVGEEVARLDKANALPPGFDPALFGIPGEDEIADCRFQEALESEDPESADGNFD